VAAASPARRLHHHGDHLLPSILAQTKHGADGTTTPNTKTEKVFADMSQMFCICLKIPQNKS
jgi:hypothetical protein